jgi:hypothetical protein
MTSKAVAGIAIGTVSIATGSILEGVSLIIESIQNRISELRSHQYVCQNRISRLDETADIESGFTESKAGCYMIKQPPS